MGVLKSFANMLYQFVMWGNSSAAMLGVVQSDLSGASSFLEKSTFNTIYLAVTPVAIQLAIIYFLLELIDLSTSGKLNFESITKGFLKLILTVFIIDNAFELLKYCAQFGDTLCDLIMENEQSYVFKNISTNNIGILSLWSMIGEIISLIPAFIKMIVLIIASKLIVYGRIIELGTYLALSPLAFPSFVSQGFSGSAMKYIKKYAAICLQGCVIAITIIVGSRIRDLSFVYSLSLGSGSFATGLGSGLIIYLCLLYMLFQSRRISNEILGIQ